MSLGLAVRFARRELRGGIRGFRVFLACLALGVAAIAAVAGVRLSINEGLLSEGATLLGGDAEITLTYRTATGAERAWLESKGRVSEVIVFRSLAAGEGDAADSPPALTQVKAVDAAYPLLGEAVLTPAMPLSQALAGADGLPGAVAERALVERMGLAVGDTLRLGRQDFRLMAVLDREPDAPAAVTLGPRTLVRTADLAGSGLLEAGTLFSARYRLRTPPGTDLAGLKRQARAEFGSDGFRWRDRRNADPNLQQVVDRLSAFLTLAGLAGLTVGGVGISAAVRSFLADRRGTIATLKVLGAGRRLVYLVYGVQVAALAALGILIGLALGALLPMLAVPWIETQAAVPVGAAVQPAALAQAALYGALTAALFTIWPLAATERVRAAALYRDAAIGRGGWPRPRHVMATAAVFAMLAGSAAILTGEARITLWTTALLVAAFVALLGVAVLVRALARVLRNAPFLRRRVGVRLALGAVGGPGSEALAVVLSLGLGLSVLAAVGQIDANLRGAIARDLPKVAPSFFVLDLQDAELGPFRQLLAADDAVTKVETAPMLRGIIARINGRPAREVTDHWVVRGDRGVTFSDRMPEGTRLTAGSWWPEDYAGPPLVSFSANEAAAIGLKVGDTIAVNILGREIEATVASLREVDFATAGIGFVLAMNPAALAGAPHSSIATIYAAPAADGRILRAVAGKFPNVTMIGVRDAVARLTEVLGAIAAAVRLGAAVTLLTGAIVLVGAAATAEKARVFEAAVLKTLGASRRMILGNFVLRSVILGGAAGALAILTGALSGWAVGRFVLGTPWRFAPESAILIVLGGIALTVAAGLVFAWRPLAMPPARVLRARE